jgi:PadR family transcriptional regulator, regulatory protein PadR
LKESTEKDTGHSFEDYFKRAISPMLVLYLLGKQPMYVYQLSQELANRSDGEYTTSFLYPVLYRLQQQGFVAEVDKQVSEGNRVRNYYGITGEGREHLSKLLSEFDRMVKSVSKIIGNDCSGGNDIGK